MVAEPDHENNMIKNKVIRNGSINTFNMVISGSSKLKINSETDHKKNTTNKNKYNIPNNNNNNSTNSNHINE